MNLSLVSNYIENRVLEQYLILYILLELVLSTAELQAVSTGSHRQYLGDAVHLWSSSGTTVVNPVSRQN